jgi:hypothetical protein
MASKHPGFVLSSADIYLYAFLLNHCLLDFVIRSSLCHRTKLPWSPVLRLHVLTSVLTFALFIGKKGRTEVGCFFVFPRTCTRDLLMSSFVLRSSRGMDFNSSLQSRPNKCELQGRCCSCSCCEGHPRFIHGYLAS